MEITDLYPWLERPAAALRKMRDKLPGGVLIYGPRGSGAYELAASFAASVVCSSPKDGVACGSCADCRLVQAGTHPDLKYVLSETEAALRPEPWNGKIQPLPKGKSFSKQILIEQVREIGEYLSVTAFRSDHRAVLIYPAESMSEDQSSALLKTLEEPPEGAVLILVADDVSSILPTIRSRCQLVRVAPPTREQGIAYLKSQKVRNPESELARLGGLPLLIHESGANLLLEKKDEKMILDLLAKGALMTSGDVLEAVKNDLTIGPLVAVMQRWCWDISAQSMGLESRYFPDYAAAVQSLSAQIDIRRFQEFNAKLNQASRSKDHPLSKKLVAQTLLMDYASALKASQKNY